MKHLSGRPEFEHILTARVFPQLPLHTLAALACSSRALRDLLYAPAAQFSWRDAAACHMPRHLPSLQDMDRVGIQRLMQRRSTAVQTLAGGAGTRLTSEIEGDTPERPPWSHVRAAPL